MRSTQSRNFYTAVLVFLLALLILGISLRYMVSDYLTENAFAQLDNNCQVLSELTAAYYTDGSVSNMQFILNKIGRAHV